MKDQFSAPLTS